jgi:hypothetical protein
MKFTPNSENERIIFSTLSEHLIFWLEKCQYLERSKDGSLNERTSSQNQSVTESEQSSEPSMCSYIVDPKEEIKMKPIREDLKQQLQLNLAKVDFLRKEEM